MNTLSKKYNLLKDLNIINHIIHPSYKNEDILKITAFSENLLLKGNEFKFDLDIEVDYIKNEESKKIELKSFNKERNNKYISFSFNDRINENIKDEKEYIELVWKNGYGKSILLPNNFSDIDKSKKYRIYDSIIFLHKDFNKAQEDLSCNKSLYDLYEKSLLEYSEKSGYPFVYYDICFNDYGNIMYKFDKKYPFLQSNSDTVIERSIKNISLYKQKILNHTPHFTSKEATELKKEIFKDLSSQELLLTNFWISYILDRWFEKYNDIKMFVLTFEEPIVEYSIEERIQ